MKSGIRKKTAYFDYNLLAVVILLICFGLVMLYSASAYEAATSKKFGFNDMYFLKKQALISIGSIIVALFVARRDYHTGIKWSLGIYFVALGLMALVRLSPLGVAAGGARRWLKIGIQFQPSELAKIAIILLLAKYLTEIGENIKTWKGVLLGMIFGLVQSFGAYYFTDNLSTALIIFMISVIMIFLSHPRTLPFLAAGGVSFVILQAFLAYVGKYVDGSSQFRMRRILVWLHPESYLSSGGFQVMQGLYAIGSGGFFGKGLGSSTQKLSTIPEAQNDMIFSIVCEELGLFGATLLLILFGYLFYRLYVIAKYAPDLNGSLIVSGILIHFALQVILNISVVLNVIPTTGVTLPLISYGGTSVLFLMLEIGLALSVSRQITFEPKAKTES